MRSTQKKWGWEISSSSFSARSRTRFDLTECPVRVHRSNDEC